MRSSARPKRPVPAPETPNVAGLELPASQQSTEIVHGGNTAISRDTFEHIAKAFGEVPEGFTVHKKLKKLCEQRVEMGTNGKVNWGMGELLAFGSLLMEGTDVRMSGQDVQRGTFVQRHAVLQITSPTTNGHRCSISRIIRASYVSTIHFCLSTVS